MNVHEGYVRPDDADSRNSDGKAIFRAIEHDIFFFNNNIFLDIFD